MEWLVSLPFVTKILVIMVFHVYKHVSIIWISFIFEIIIAFAFNVHVHVLMLVILVDFYVVILTLFSIVARLVLICSFFITCLISMIHNASFIMLVCFLSYELSFVPFLFMDVTKSNSLYQLYLIYQI